MLYLKTLMEILEEKRARDDEIRARDEDALIGPVRRPLSSQQGYV